MQQTRQPNRNPKQQPKQQLVSTPTQDLNTQPAFGQSAFPQASFGQPTFGEPTFGQPSFAQSATQAPQGTEEPDASKRPGWLIPAIVMGVVMMLCMMGGTLLMLTNFNDAVVEAVNENRAAEAEAKSQRLIAAQQQFAAAAAANPLPATWDVHNARGVKIQMPTDATIRELNSPIQGNLLLRIAATQPDNNAAIWLTEMPIPVDTPIKRDQWLRNMFQYSGGQPREVVDVVRDGKSGTRFVLERDGERKDPMLEVFMLPQRMVVVSVQPAGSKFDEAFFASLQFPSDAPVETQVASSGGQSSPSTGDPAVEPTGDESRRKRLYLEYKKYASANSSRAALPGIKARDAIDQLVNQVNENQVQAFLQIHNLSERELNAIISEGTSKNWQPPK